jgi:uncharacterized membrane protein YgcG
MKRLLILVALLVAHIGLSANFTTQSWRTDVVISKDRGFSITETISLTFTKPQRGILRRIPFRTKGSSGQSRQVDYALQGVKADYGHGFESTPVQQNHRGGDWELRIGDPNITRTGSATYKIVYSVRGGLTDFPKDKNIGARTELYWNFIGTTWPTAIDDAEGSVSFPKPTGQDLAARIVVGEIGSRRGVEVYPRKKGVGRFDLLTASFKGNVLNFKLKKGLKLGEGVTLVLGLPTGTVSKASVAPTPPRGDTTLPPDGVNEIPRETSSDYPFPNPMPSIQLPDIKAMASNPLALFPPFLGLGFFYLVIRNRFEPRQGPLTVRFEPPDGVGASESGLVLDDRTDPRDIVAGIISLAQKGAAKITHREGMDLSVELLGMENGKGLTSFEKILYRAVEPYGPEITSGSLRGSFGVTYQALDVDLQYQAQKMDLYAGRVAGTRSLYGFLMMLCVVVAAGVTCMWSPVYSIIGCVLALFVGSLIVSKVSNLTPHGSRIKGQILGLREFISRAHERELNYMTEKMPHQALFERLLPYAVAFGLSRQWASAFEGMDIQQPDWYDSPAGDDMLWTSMLIHDLNYMDDAWPGAMTYTPPPPDNDTSSFGSGGGFSSGDSGFGGGFSSGGGSDGGGSFSGGADVGGGGGGGGGDSW